MPFLGSTHCATCEPPTPPPDHASVKRPRESFRWYLPYQLARFDPLSLPMGLKIKYPTLCDNTSQRRFDEWLILYSKMICRAAFRPGVIPPTESSLIL